MLLLVQAAVGRDQVDHQHQVGRSLAHGHADCACTSFGAIRGSATETRFCTSTCAWSTLVPGLKTTLIESAPFAGRCEDHVEHVVDAVDLLLDRRRDRLGDHLGGGARIGGGGQSRSAARISGNFGDRQRPKRDVADQRHDDRHDARKDSAGRRRSGKNPMLAAPKWNARAFISRRPLARRLRSCRPRA